MRRALASLVGFAGACLVVPTFADEASPLLGPLVGPLLGAFLGSVALRLLLLGQNLHPEDLPRKA